MYMATPFNKVCRGLPLIDVVNAAHSCGRPQLVSVVIGDCNQNCDWGCDKNRSEVFVRMTTHGDLQFVSSDDGVAPLVQELVNNEIARLHRIALVSDIPVGGIINLLNMLPNTNITKNNGYWDIRKHGNILVSSISADNIDFRIISLLPAAICEKLLENIHLMRPTPRHDMVTLQCGENELTINRAAFSKYCKSNCDFIIIPVVDKTVFGCIEEAIYGNLKPTQTLSQDQKYDFLRVCDRIGLTLTV